MLIVGGRFRSDLNRNVVNVGSEDVESPPSPDAADDDRNYRNALQYEIGDGHCASHGFPQHGTVR